MSGSWYPNQPQAPPQGAFQQWGANQWPQGRQQFVQSHPPMQGVYGQFQMQYGGIPPQGSFPTQQFPPSQPGLALPQPIPPHPSGLPVPQPQPVPLHPSGFPVQQVQAMQQKQQAYLQEQQRKAKEEQKKREFEMQKRRLKNINVVKPTVNPLDDLFGKQLPPIGRGDATPSPASSMTSLPPSESGSSSHMDVGTKEDEVELISEAITNEPQPVSVAIEVNSEPQPKSDTVGTFEKLMTQSLSNLDKPDNAKPKRFQPLPAAASIPKPQSQPPAKTFSESKRARAWTANAGEFSNLFIQPQDDGFGEFHSTPAQPSGAFSQQSIQPLSFPAPQPATIQQSLGGPIPSSQPQQMSGQIASQNVSIGMVNLTSMYSGPLSATSSSGPSTTGRGQLPGQTIMSPSPQSNIPGSQAAELPNQNLPTSAFQTQNRQPASTPPGVFTNLNASRFPPIYAEVYNKCSLSGEPFVSTEVLFPILVSSQLPREVLRGLWTMANRTTPGRLNQTELFVLLGLIGLAQAGNPSPTLEDLKRFPQPPVPILAAIQPPPKGSATQLPMVPPTQPSMAPPTQPSMVPSTQPSMAPLTQPSMAPPTQPPTAQTPPVHGDDFGEFQASGTFHSTLLLPQSSPLPIPGPPQPSTNIQPVIPVKLDVSSTNPQDRYSVFNALRQTEPSPNADESHSREHTPISVSSAPSLPQDKYAMFKDLHSERVQPSVPLEQTLPQPPLIEPQPVIRRTELTWPQLSSNLGKNVTPAPATIFKPQVTQPLASSQATVPISTELSLAPAPPTSKLGDILPTMSGSQDQKNEGWANFTVRSTAPSQSLEMLIETPLTKEQPISTPSGLEILEKELTHKLSQTELEIPATIGEVPKPLIPEPVKPTSDEDFGEFEAYSSPKLRKSSSSAWKGGEGAFPTNWGLVSQAPESSAPAVWKTCLSKCEEVLEASADVFSSVQETGVLNEIVSSEEGRNKLRGIVEVYRLAKRIYCSMRSRDSNASDAEGHVEAIQRHWKALATTLPQNVMEQLYSETTPTFEDTEENDVLSGTISKCSVCLMAKKISIPISFAMDGTKEEYGLQLLFHKGQSYHLTCANFWSNVVQEELPGL